MRATAAGGGCIPLEKGMQFPTRLLPLLKREQLRLRPHVDRVVHDRGGGGDAFLEVGAPEYLGLGAGGEGGGFAVEVDEVDVAVGGDG